jgi:hypothetical protein
MRTVIALVLLVVGGWLLYAVVTGADILPAWLKNVLGGSLGGVIGSGSSGQQNSGQGQGQTGGTKPPGQGVQ